MIIKKFLTGSRYYFDGIEGFNPHDTDYIIIVDKMKTVYNHVHNNNTCYFYYRNSTLKNIVSYIIAKNTSLICASLLHKDFAEYIGLTITELKTNDKLMILFENMPIKWKYLHYVYKSYIENNGFYLTDEQRMHAYNLYCDARK